MFLGTLDRLQEVGRKRRGHVLADGEHETKAPGGGDVLWQEEGTDGRRRKRAESLF